MRTQTILHGDDPSLSLGMGFVALSSAIGLGGLLWAAALALAPMVVVLAVAWTLIDRIFDRVLRRWPIRPPRIATPVARRGLAGAA